MRPTVADIVVSLEAPPLVVDDLRFVHDGTRFGPLSMQLQPGEQATMVLAAALLRPPLLQALLATRLRCVHWPGFRGVCVSCLSCACE